MAVSFPMDGSVVGGKNQKRTKSENKISVRRVDGTAAIKAAGPNGIAISIPYVDQQQCWSASNQKNSIKFEGISLFFFF
jgi:hypothetical protein